MVSPTSTATPANLKLRRFVAVLAGLIVVIITSTGMDAIMLGTGVFPKSGRMPDQAFLIATAYRTIFGVLGGYVTARLAPDKPLTHAVVLGGIGTLISIVGAALTWNNGPEFGPHWYPVALLILSLPSAWLGGRIAAR